MNDFGQDISGLTGVVKPRRFCPQNATVKQRSFTLVSGWGCKPDLNTGRKIYGHWTEDGSLDEISSYDLDYVIGKDGKRVDRLPEKEEEI